MKLFHTPFRIHNKSMSDSLKDSIKSNAEGPRKATGDQGSVENHSIQDQIEADRYLASQEAVKSKSRGFILGRFKPGGAH